MGYLNPVYVADGNEVLIFVTAQLGSMTRTILPSQPQHHPVNWRYATNLYLLHTTKKEGFTSQHIVYYTVHTGFLTYS